MTKKAIDEVRLFQILYENMEFYNGNLHNLLLNYVDKYIKYKSISSVELKKNYETFLKQYTKDAKEYLKTGIYPAIKNNCIKDTITREEYDVFLLLSTILTQHRFDIMFEISKGIRSIKDTKNALVIGSGVGIELEIIKDNYKHIDAYDIEIDKFCNETHKDVIFYEEEFNGNTTSRYDDIFIIELLEHIPNPYELLRDAKKVLNKNGRVIITLAVNIPQFDHVFNFDDMDEFNKQVNKLNLYIENEKNIQHKYLMNGLDFSSNIFVVLKEKL